MADTQNANVQERDIHQLLKVKREKLANLQQAGKDPFQITKYDCLLYTSNNGRDGIVIGNHVFY